jgi:transglutaminase-like putative cysteine protease
MGGWAIRGVALLLLLAGYLWLPSLRGRDMRAAAIVVGACGIAAIPLGAGLDTKQPWLDYRHWNWFSEKVAGTTFAWDHSYGPMTWSRTGTKLLAIRSKEPHYWKAETLDRFDGLRWIHSESSFRGAASSGAGDIPEPIHQQWNERIQVSLQRLSTKVVIGAGTVYRVDSDHSTAAEPDGTVKVLDSPMQDGESYKVYAYVPDPTAAQMRAAPRTYPDQFASYTYFDLPGARQSGLKRTPVSATERVEYVTDHTIQPIAPNQPLTAADRARVLSSPYGRVYDLAQRLAANKPTTYDVVRAIQTHLQRGFEYSEKPPARRYPLSAFLFQDKIGYCQQFSGAMALMLRMLGIPSRVATGFAPGGRDPERNNFLVDDTDAHDWVEVFFPSIGWVTFDPTPGAAPAATQLDDNDLGVTKSPQPAVKSTGPAFPDSPGGTVALHKRPTGGAHGPGAQSTGPDPWIPLGAAAGALALAALAAYGWRRRRRDHLGPDRLADAELAELDRALERIGSPLPAGATLLRAEDLLGGLAGTDAAAYAAKLAERRYRHPAVEPPDVHERRALRRALLRATGRRSLLRVLRAIPPGGPSPRTGRGAGSTATR